MHLGGRPKLVLVLVAFAAAMSPATAGAEVDLAQADTPDPVAVGAPVTYTVTATNNGPSAESAVQIELFSLSVGGASGVPNPYVSFAVPSGHCIPVLIGEYQTADCDIGPLAAGESRRFTATVQANVSMDHVIGQLDCPAGIENGCQAGPGASVYERTTVIVPPEISGSAKLKLNGLPAGCVSGDLELKARAKGDKIREIKAKLTGKNLRENLGRAEGRKLKFTIEAAELEQARFYELNVNVVRKGMPGLKRSVSLQRC